MNSNIMFYSNNWEIGSHVGFSNNILPTFQEAVNQGMYSLQFFMGNPKSYNRQRISSNDISNSRSFIQRFPLNVFTHFPYVANLNGSVTTLAWNGDTNQDIKTTYMLKEIEYELSIISNFNVKKNGVVIHPGCYPDKEIGLDTIAKSINKINFSDNSMLLLENCAGEGRKLCKNFEEIKRVFDGVDVNKKDHIGVCIDTCHTFASGLYNLQSCDEIDRMFFDFHRLIGLQNFSLLHLNDSETIFGSKRDRHAILGNGYIWKDRFESLLYLLSKCEENNIPIILETTPLDMITIYNLRQK